MTEIPSAEGLLAHTQDKVALLDPQGRITYANEAVAHILGYESAELTGENAFEYVHPDDREAVETAFTETIETEEYTETTVEYRFRAADGSWVWLESRMSNMTDEGFDGYVVSSRDISSRVAAEREHQKTATRLRELAATTSDVLWMFNDDWTELLFINPAYEDIYGGSVEELEVNPQSFLETVHPDDEPIVREAMERLSSGKSVDIEHRVNPDEDYDVWVWVQAEPIVEDGEVVRITGFTRDVTDRHRRERQLHVLDNLLRHNLRNDLTTIVSNADLIETQLPDAADQTAAIRRTSEELLASAEKEREIIDLLTDGGTERDFPIGELLEDSAELIEEELPGASVEITCPESLSVTALEAVRSAFVELLENAIRHSNYDQPTVRITVHEQDQQVVVEIADDGPPIPEMEAQVLTGQHDMNDTYHSTGLGLWLVHWAVSLSDGDITVTSDDDGNVIRVSLPRTSEDAES